ncbi:hypothetical protein WN943_022837 [Citrus x changshan-huyou]
MNLTHSNSLLIIFKYKPFLQPDFFIWVSYNSRYYIFPCSFLLILWIHLCRYSLKFPQS